MNSREKEFGTYERREIKTLTAKKAMIFLPDARLGDAGARCRLTLSRRNENSA